MISLKKIIKVVIFYKILNEYFLKEENNQMEFENKGNYKVI